MTEKRSGLPVLGFADRSSLERWIAAQPDDTAGVWIKFAKKGAISATLTKADAIDVALCHGWIDGKLEKYDDRHWLVRFTPRKSRSTWSALNRDQALTLIKEGRMRPAGLAQIEAARADGRWEGAYAPASRAEIPSDLEKALAKNPKASAFFATLNSRNRYAILYRIGAVKKAETRARKIAEFVAMLARGETIHG
ncbi:MAG TPA: YdeI/OmpD-associated family protein [Stellaceae bacterium]|nr:YdeI/OmpD-associated family protein [Stellaceae bacterium]